MNNNKFLELLNILKVEEKNEAIKF